MSSLKKRKSQLTSNLSPKMKVIASLWHPEYPGCDIVVLENDNRTSEWLGFSLDGSRYLAAKASDQVVTDFMDHRLTRGEVIAQSCPWILAMKQVDGSFGDLVMTDALPKEWISIVVKETTC